MGGTGVGGAGSGVGGADVGPRFCPGCGLPAGECPGCLRPSDPWHWCPACGRWLAVQVTPTGWAADCRGCGAHHDGTHRR